MALQTKLWSIVTIGLFLWAGYFYQTNTALKPSSYVKWVENLDHDLHKVKQIGAYRFDIQYKPTPYIIAMEKRTDELETLAFEKRKLELGDEMDYFNFKISPAHKQQNILLQTAQNEKEYFELIDYLSYNAKNDFYLLNGPDTSFCHLYQFVRNYELAPHLEFVLGFKKTVAEDRTFVFDDKSFGVGPIRAIIEQQKINQLPDLKTY